MASVDKLLKASQDPSCVMAVFPYQGGIWASPLGGASGVDPIPGSADTGSWAVRNGLLAYHNMEIRDGAFTQINPSTQHGVITPLDLRGKEIDHTFIVRAKFGENPVRLFRVPIIGQGIIFSNASYTVCGMCVCCEDNSGCEVYQFSPGFIDENGNLHRTYNALITDDIYTSCTTYAASMKYSDNRVTIAHYINGELWGGNVTVAVSGNRFYTPPTVEAYSYSDRVRLGGSSPWDDWQTGVYDRYEYGMVFNRVLTAEEIKALS